ncbi:MAG: hypothetical protein WCO52_04935 [bacterium]
MTKGPDFTQEEVPTDPLSKRLESDAIENRRFIRRSHLITGCITLFSAVLILGIWLGYHVVLTDIPGHSYYRVPISLMLGLILVLASLWASPENSDQVDQGGPGLSQVGPGLYVNTITATTPRLRRLIGYCLLPLFLVPLPFVLISVAQHRQADAEDYCSTSTAQSYILKYSLSESHSATFITDYNACMAKYGY